MLWQLGRRAKRAGVHPPIPPDDCDGSVTAGMAIEQVKEFLGPREAGHDDILHRQDRERSGVAPQ